jgi:hypothetical protein
MKSCSDKGEATVGETDLVSLISTPSAFGTQRGGHLLQFLAQARQTSGGGRAPTPNTGSTYSHTLALKHTCADQWRGANLLVLDLVLLLISSHLFSYRQELAENYGRDVWPSNSFALCLFFPKELHETACYY